MHMVYAVFCTYINFILLEDYCTAYRDTHRHVALLWLSTEIRVFWTGSLRGSAGTGIGPRRAYFWGKDVHVDTNVPPL